MPAAPAAAQDPRVVSVIVTFNRLALLRQCLAAVLAQDRPADVVVVVDNASTDGTAGWLQRVRSSCDVVTLTRNLGGAGGFSAGLQRALEVHRADAVWLLDDDTVPEPHALRELVRTWEHPDRGPSPALVASRVLWTDGSDHPMNTPRPVPWRRRTDLPSCCTPVRSASFVSILVDGDAARQTGLPVADYFLWNDDFEYTARLLRHRQGVRCSASVVVHRTPVRGDSDRDPGPRFYYEVRNKLWALSRSRCLAPWERPLYAAAAVARWTRAVRRSRHRRDLLRSGAHGLRDGVRTAPRPTLELLGGGSRG